MHPVSHASPVAHDEWRERLSRLVDGDADPDDVAVLCRRWSDDEQSRSAWHEYHLIGDVLRSEELAVPAVRQADFLAQLRVKLQDEPVVLAPAAPASAQCGAAAQALMLARSEAEGVTAMSHRGVGWTGGAERVHSCIWAADLAAREAQFGRPERPQCSQEARPIDRRIARGATPRGILALCCRRCVTPYALWPPRCVAMVAGCARGYAPPCVVPRAIRGLRACRGLGTAHDRCRVAPRMGPEGGV